jgi:hypothetical protein
MLYDSYTMVRGTSLRQRAEHCNSLRHTLHPDHFRPHIFVAPKTCLRSPIQAVAANVLPTLLTARTSRNASCLDGDVQIGKHVVSSETDRRSAQHTSRGHARTRCHAMNGHGRRSSSTDSVKTVLVTARDKTSSSKIDRVWVLTVRSEADHRALV